MKPPFIWDSYSDQPHVIKDKAYKKKMKKPHTLDYVKLFLTSLFILPLATFFMKLFKGNMQTQIGLCVNLDKGYEQFELVEELQVKNLLIRVPLWEIDKLSDFVAFANGFGDDKNIVICILQDRENIENHQLFRKNITMIFEAFKNITDEFQIANAINRTKWGFFSVSEYLDFYKIAQQVRDEKYPNIKLIGPSVIDFEYYYTVRALFNNYDLKFDRLSSLLYVDRRGAPQNNQYAIFDTQNKIDLLYAIAKISPKTTDEIYITEVNWPLKNTAPYAPTGEKECVSEEEYAQYLKDYLDICQKSGKVSKVFWHQLIAPGYGLVDNRDAKIRKTKAFYEFKRVINENIC